MTRTTTTLMISSAIMWFGCGGAQPPVRGTITGKVTTDQGLRGIRVAAHNLDRRIWYTVFTKNGQYTVPQALPGRYEMMAVEPGYDSARVSVQLAPGESRTADVALEKSAAQANAPLQGGDEGPFVRGAHGGSTVYFDTLDQLYPEGPAKALLRANC